MGVRWDPMALIVIAGAGGGGLDRIIIECIRGLGLRHHQM